MYTVVQPPAWTSASIANCSWLSESPSHPETISSSSSSSSSSSITPSVCSLTHNIIMNNVTTAAQTLSNLTTDLVVSYAPAVVGNWWTGGGSNATTTATTGGADGAVVGSFAALRNLTLTDDPMEALFQKFPDSVMLPKIGRVSMDVLLFCGSVALGSLCVWRRRRFLWRQQQRKYGNNNSPNSHSDPREESQRHAWKRTNGFKDPGLYEHIQTCTEKKKTLRKVDDPDVTRKAKLLNFKLHGVVVKPSSSGKGQTTTGLALSPDRLQSERSRLRNVTNKPTDFGVGVGEDLV